MHTKLARFYIAEIRKEDVILGTNWLLEHNPKVNWHAYGLHFTRCPPSCQIKEELVKAQRATRKLGHPNTEIWHMVIVPRKSDYSILSQKPGKAQPGQKAGNTIVPNPQIIPKIWSSQLKGSNWEHLQAQAKHYKAPTWTEEDTQEDGIYKLALPSTDLEEDGVYLVRCLNTGKLEALELYNDSKEGLDIH